MPVNVNEKSDAPLYQRDLYARSILTRTYWNLKDRWIIKSIPTNAKMIVDLGCGEGITLQAVAGRFPDADVLGVDFLDENIAICKSQGLNAEQGDVFNLSMDDSSVDAVIFMEVVEHLENHTAAINEIRRILKPGGVLIIGFPNDKFFYYARLALLKFKEAAYDPGHVKQWTPKTLSRELVDASFVIKKVYCLPMGIWPLSLHSIIVCEKK